MPTPAWDLSRRIPLGSALRLALTGHTEANEYGGR
jgi:hypothetical protein